MMSPDYSMRCMAKILSTFCRVPFSNPGFHSLRIVGAKYITATAKIIFMTLNLAVKFVYDVE